MREWIDIVTEAAGLDDLKDRLIDLRYSVEGMGGIFDVMLDDGAIMIDMISLPLDRQKQGLGTEIMREVCDIADSFGRAIKLEAVAYGKKEIGQKKLEAFYEKFGFKKTGEFSMEGHPIMERQPVKPS